MTDQGARQLEHRRLTVVSGTAGCGKTHHVRSAVGDAPSIWLSMRPHDRAVETAGLLVRRALERLGALPADLVAAIGPGSGPTSDSDALGRADQLATLVAGGLADSLDRDLVVVIDDLDVLDHADGPYRFVESLVRASPTSVHFVLVTRTGLRF